MEAIALRLEAIASRLEAIALRLEAIASRWEAIALRLEAIPSRLVAIVLSLEAIAIVLEAIASRLELIASRLEEFGSRLEAIASANPLLTALTDFGMIAVSKHMWTASCQTLTHSKKDCTLSWSQTKSTEIHEELLSLDLSESRAASIALTPGGGGSSKLATKLG